MNHPLFLVCLKQAKRVRELSRDNQRLERGMAVVVSANGDLMKQAAGWQARAESLAQALDPDQREAILRTHAWIDKVTDR